MTKTRAFLAALCTAVFGALLAAVFLTPANAAGPSPVPLVEGKTVTCTTNGAGFCTFNHELGVVPDSVVVELNVPNGGQPNLPYQTAVTGRSSTQATARFLTTTGGSYANQAVTFYVELVGGPGLVSAK